MRFLRIDNLSYLIEVSPTQVHELKIITLQEKLANKSYKRTPNPYLIFRSDVQRSLKCTVGKASSVSRECWKTADAVLKKHYTDIYEGLADEKPNNYEFKIYNPQSPKKSSKKLKELKSPTPKHLNKRKDTVDPCSSTPSDALADSQLGLHSSSVDTNGEGTTNIRPPSTQCLNTTDSSPAPLDTLSDHQFGCNYNSGNFFDEGIRAPTILLAQHLNNQDSNFCPPTPSDEVRTLPDFLFESAKLTDEENLYLPQMIALAPIPIDENIGSHSTVG
ncbi:1888_t:CDS:2, partial [Paraglomus occultum]